jgi:transposase-like protein
MRHGTRGRYTLEFKQEAVRLIESGQTMAAAARIASSHVQNCGTDVSR